MAAKAIYDAMLRVRCDPASPFAELHGWRLTATPRTASRERVDITALHLATGERIHSLVSLRQRLGLEESGTAQSISRAQVAVTPQKRRRLSEAQLLQSSAAADAGLPRTMHKGYAHAIAPRPEESAPLLEGQCVAVYFEDYDDWFEGVLVTSMAAGSDSVVVRFEDGEHSVTLAPETYGRFNCWVVPETGWREEWRADGHALLGRRLVHEGADGVLRMWCGARRMFAMSVCDDAETGIEAEMLVSEVDAARSVAQQQPLPRQSTESEGQPPHAHEGTQHILPLLQNLRQTIVDRPGGKRQRQGSSSQGISDSCRHASLAALLGLNATQYFHFLDYAERGHMPTHSPNAALYTAAIGLATQVRTATWCELLHAALPCCICHTLRMLCALCTARDTGPIRGCRRVRRDPAAHCVGWRSHACSCQQGARGV